jgi:hypothetical protein
LALQYLHLPDGAHGVVLARLEPTHGGAPGPRLRGAAALDLIRGRLDDPIVGPRLVGMACDLGGFPIIVVPSRDDALLEFERALLPPARLRAIPLGPPALTPFFAAPGSGLPGFIRPTLPGLLSTLPPFPVAPMPVSATPRPSDQAVRRMSAEERFRIAITVAADELGGEMRAQLLMLVEPEVLAVMATLFAIWAIGHFFGAALIADIILLAVGFAVLGAVAIEVAENLVRALGLISDARTYADLVEAGRLFARIAATISIFALLSVLMWMAGRGMVRRRAPARDPAPPPPEPARPAPRTEPPPSAAPAVPLRGPAARHTASRVTQRSVAKDVNTVIEPGVRVADDVAAINAGQAVRSGNTFAVNGRTYGVHDGTLYPISGPGFHTLSRGGYKALGVYNTFGNTPRAAEILSRMGTSSADNAAALRVFEIISP